MTIASGGCNTLSYLVANPARVTAVDLNGAHVALTRLKLAGRITFPTMRCFAGSSWMHRIQTMSPPLMFI